MRQLLLIVLASCGGTAAPESSSQPEPVAAPHRAEPAPFAIGEPVARASNGPVAEPMRERITASPSGGINAVAITEDAKIAVTIDDTRSVRLWPSLDGKLE